MKGHWPDRDILWILYNRMEVIKQKKIWSPSNNLSEEDLFILDTSELGTSMTMPPQNVEDVQLASGAAIQTNEESGGDSSTTNPSEDEVPAGNPFSTDLSGAKQSPPVQVMGKSDVMDPNRIPSSIFARTNTATPMEWSVASNESLFSIHMGNNSFSRDQALLISKSQELGIPSSSVTGTPIITPPITPSAAPRHVNFEEPGATEAANAEAMKDIMRVTAEGCSEKDRTSSETGPRRSTTTSHSRLSDGSVCSFAFPILSGEGRDGSIKVVPDQQPSQTEHQPPSETPKTVPSAAGNKWFSCLSCCPFCH